MRPKEYTEEYEINGPLSRRPHVVILGAGASYAAFPNGDKNGRKLPLLKDFVDVIGLTSLMAEAGVQPPYDDFEGIYSEIAMDRSRESIRQRIDKAVFSYFEGLELPETPTLYDHLVLSLCPKDVIATFNWDPFLWNACHRNRSFGGTPIILFLHGCVATCLCGRCKTVIARGFPWCPKCRGKLTDIPILFPVTQKNYNSHPVIAAHWRTLKEALKECWALTIFGYSAPRTDVEAVTLMKEGWGKKETRQYEEVEIIDIRDEDSILSSWKEFILDHHFTITDSFYSSYIGKHPRRSCEALFSRLMQCMVLKPFPTPRHNSFPELYDYLRPRIDAENKN